MQNPLIIDFGVLFDDLQFDDPEGILEKK